MNYKDLIGKYIVNFNETNDYIDFITNDNYVFRIYSFEPYCVCNVGEYIDEIITNGTCFGVITDIKVDIDDEWKDEICYKGVVSFYFENGKIDFKVHGEDNGFYGVSFTMPVEIFKGDNNE